MKKPQKFVHYDSREDILYLGIRKGAEEEFVELSPGVGVELDKSGKVIGLEILDASKILKPMFQFVQRREKVKEKVVVGVSA